MKAACNHSEGHSSTQSTSSSAVQEAEERNAEQAGKLRAAAQELAAAQQRSQAAQEHSLSSLQRLRTQGGEAQQAADAAAQAQQEVGCVCSESNNGSSVLPGLSALPRVAWRAEGYSPRWHSQSFLTGFCSRQFPVAASWALQEVACIEAAAEPRWRLSCHVERDRLPPEDILQSP